MRRPPDRAPLKTRLAPAEWFPAGVAGITVRQLPLASGISVRVLEAGPAHGPAVLFVHGWGVSAYLWRHNILPLAAAGYRVLAMDLPGHGLSDAPQALGAYSLASFARSVHETLDACDVSQAVLVGQSMGGKIVAQVAMDAPARVRRLVLFGPVGFGLIPPWLLVARSLPLPSPAWVSPLVPRALVAVVQRRVYGKLGWFTERDIDEYWAPTQFPAVVRAQLQMVREFAWDLWEPSVLAQLRTPTHVIFGTRDRTVRPRAAAALAVHLHRGHLTWIEDGGHVVMEEVAERINALLVAELAAV